MSNERIARIELGDKKAAHAADRLTRERVAWMTTVAADGTPQTSPIWFVREGDEFLMYSRTSARVRNIENNPGVSLNLDGNGLGGDVIIVEGSARIVDDAPSAAENAEYLAKYRPVMDKNGWTPEWFADHYPVAVRITPTRYRFW